MSYFDTIYQKRLNRYGDNRQTRLEGARRANFEAFLSQSPHYTVFTYGDKEVECVFEPFKLSESKNQMHLLTRADEVLTIGDTAHIAGDLYMFFYLDERKESGYNRYVALRLNHSITWHDKDGVPTTKNAFLYSKMSGLGNEPDARGRVGARATYLENSTDFTLIMPSDATVKINDYLIVDSGGKTQYFRTKGFDYVSTPGVMYVTIDPTYERNLTPIEKTTEDSPDDFFWLIGGEDSNG